MKVACEIRLRKTEKIHTSSSFVQNLQDTDFTKFLNLRITHRNYYYFRLKCDNNGELVLKLNFLSAQKN